MELNEIKITKLLYKPKSSLVPELIYGVRFAGFQTSPKVYVVETEDDLSNLTDINFKVNNILYTLNDIIEHKSCQKGTKIIECVYWKEEVIE